MTNLDGALTLDELCAKARIAKSTYRWLAAKGDVPVAFKVGRRYYFLPEDVDAWIESRIQRIDPRGSK